MGCIILITGPMFSGKTSELLKRINKYIISGKKCIIIRHSMDNRYTNSNKIVTHDKYFINCEVVSSSTLDNVEDKVEGYDIIGIEEGHFFKNIDEFSKKMTAKNKIILITALNGDYKQDIFLNVNSLIPIVNDIIFLTAICNTCYASASFTKRTTSDKDINIVGGIEMYQSVCNRCLFNLNI